MIRPGHVAHRFAFRGLRDGTLGRGHDTVFKAFGKQTDIPLFLQCGGLAGEETQEETIDEVLCRLGLERERGDAVTIAQARQPEPHRAVRENGGLEHVGVALAGVDRILTRSAPAKGFHQARHCLDLRQRQTGAVAFVRSRSEHPGPSRFAEGNGTLEGPHAVNIEAHLFELEGRARRREKRIDDLLGMEPTRARRDEERARRSQQRIDGALVGVRVENEPGDRL